MDKVGKSMHEFSEGKLHSGSKKGPVVKSRKQAIAIGMSEARKAGEHVAPKKHHSFESSNVPYGQQTTGKPNEHHIEQGHKVSGSDRKNDGAGRHGADESGHRSYSEHKEPNHPMSGVHSEKEGHGPGAFGYPGYHMGLERDSGHLVGDNYSQKAHEPAVLKHEPGPAGGIGTHTGMGKTPHGYGHQQSQKRGVHRLSGHAGAHMIGKRK